MKYKKLILAGLMILSVTAGVFASAPGLSTAPDFGSQGAKDKSGLTVEQVLTYAIQDEYLARSEYEAIMAVHGNVRPFSAIIKAEERHIEWLLAAFATHGLTPPVDDSRSHIIIPAELKSAYQTGVGAEVDNIAMYWEFLASPSAELPADVIELFERLANASENHLRALRNNLSRFE